MGSLYLQGLPAHGCRIGAHRATRKESAGRCSRGRNRQGGYCEAEVLMPFASPHPCNHPGCSALTSTRLCGDHEKERRREESRRRPNSAQQGYGYQWRKAARAFLELHPLCVLCFKANRVAPARVVDHIIPHRETWTCSGIARIGSHSVSAATTGKPPARTDAGD